jgi:hypothetical protein
MAAIGFVKSGIWHTDKVPDHCRPRQAYHIAAYIAFGIRSLIVNAASVAVHNISFQKTRYVHNAAVSYRQK